MGIVVVIGYRMFIHKIPQVCTDKVCFSVELARTTQEHEQGLMYRTELAPHEGMLFIFDSPGIYSFWMKNTLIPLDIIWLDDQKYIKDIQT